MGKELIGFHVRNIAEKISVGDPEGADKPKDMYKKKY